MAAVVYWTNMNMASVHLQYHPGSDIWEKTRIPTQTAGYTGQLGGSAKFLINQIMLLQVP